MTRPVGSWQQQQDELRSQRERIHAGIEQGAYEAGLARGTRGDYHTPPWMAHLSEIAPKMTNVDQFAAAHRYGQTEGYVEHAHDRIEDEFRPRAEKLAQQGMTAQRGVEAADTAYRARGIIALAGRSRYPIAPTARRSRLAHQRMDAVQGRANDFQSELQGRLDEVETMRQGLHDSPWKPHLQ